MLAGFDDDNSDDNDDDDGDDDKGKPPYLKIAGKQVWKTKGEKVENKLNKS